MPIMNKCITVAVGAFIFNKKGEVLLIRREHDPYKGYWTIPGGRVNYGETLEDALKREMMEETGLEIEIIDLVCAISLITKDETGNIKNHYVLIDYIVLAKDDKLKIAPDIPEADWYPLDQLPRLHMPNFTCEVFETVEKRIATMDIFD